jgi:hypothetical protein
MGRFCWIAPRAKSEILGLVPSNPRRNTSKQILDVLRRGNKQATCCHFVASFPIIYCLVATNRQLVATLHVPIANGDKNYNAR